MGLIEQVKKVLGETFLGEPEPEAARPVVHSPIESRVETDLGILLADAGPKGVPLSASTRQVYITKRPEWYKAKASDTYRESTEKVRLLYRKIDEKAPMTRDAIFAVVASFMPLLKTDRSILLNLSYLPSSDPDFMYTHAINASLLSMAMATKTGYSEEQSRDIAAAAMLLDIGMIRVPEAIRNKEGALTPGELFEIHKHPMIGADLLAPIQGLSPSSVLAIYQHHERMSGVGYPRQRTGHLIHEYSRILAIADIYAAMVAKRSYRDRLIPYQAMESIIKMGAAGLLDSRLIRKFLDTMSLFPVGSLVRLDSGRIGKIIKANDADYTKPVIAILQNERGGTVLPGTLLHLVDSDHEKIAEALDEGAIPQNPMDGF